MKKRLFVNVFALAAVIIISGCGNRLEAITDSQAAAVVEENQTVDITEEVSEPDETSEEEVVEESSQKLDLEDGSYWVKFDTDSTMFHVNEAMKGKALLTVNDGEGNLHLILTSKNIVNLYSGFAEDAENDKDNWIEPSVEEVTYDDGMTEEVFAFDVPVYVMEEEFDLALIGKKNVWYDHKVSISDPQVADEVSDDEAAVESTGELEAQTIEVSLEGGTGKVHLISPTKIEQNAEGYLVTIEWSSKNYDYMIVDEVKYLPVEVNETSVYEIPVKNIEESLNVIADTVAMSEPHEIEYTITFDVNTMK